MMKKSKRKSHQESPILTDRQRGEVVMFLQFLDAALDPIRDKLVSGEPVSIGEVVQQLNSIQGPYTDTVFSAASWLGAWRERLRQQQE
jgi:hypothetical protein